MAQLYMRDAHARVGGLSGGGGGGGPDSNLLEGAQVPVQIWRVDAEIQYWVQHELTRPMIRHLAAPLHPMHR